jgi:hypothetical protein
MLSLIAWLVFASVPLAAGGLGLSWDGINHQIYLGWQVEHSRVALDYMGAGVQSYQYPLSYWPAYRLAISGMDGQLAGVLLSALHMAIIPPVWLIARCFCPDSGHFGFLQRTVSLALALSNAVILKSFQSTGNDLLVAIPLLWAYALMLVFDPVGRRGLMGSGLLAGISVALKLSNAPLVLPLVVWWCLKKPTRVGIARGALGLSAILMGWGALYLPWGLQLCHEFGNPFYPFMDAWFAGMSLCGGGVP